MTDATAQTVDTSKKKPWLMDAEATETPKPIGKTVQVRRIAPLAVLLIGAGVAWYFMRDELSFAALADNRETLLAWRDANYAIAALSFAVIYIAVAAFSVPGAAWLTIAGGFLFGTILGAAYAVVGATIGATTLFLAAKTGLGDMLREKTGGWLRRLEDGVRENDVSFMLVMRLVPAVPFFIANLAPAFLGVRPVTFIWTTFIGIIPGAAVYSSIGAGLGEVFERGETPDIGVIFEPHVFLPLVGLAALAALPTVVKLIRGRRKGA